MKIKNILPLVFGLIPYISGAVLTPSGNEVPESLITFINCPIGDVLCKNGKGSSCMMHSNVCRYIEPENLAQELSNSGWEIGDLLPEQFCKIFYEVCDMINTYDPPLNDDDIFNYEKYFTCNVDDSMCQYGKKANCKAVVEKCKENDKYTQQDCDNLSIVCDAIDSGVIPDINQTTSEPTSEPTTSEPTTIPVVSNLTNPVTPSGVEVPDSLMTFLNCPIGNVLCKSGKGSSCAMNSNVCRYTEPEDLAQELSNNGWEIGNLSPEQFCNVFFEVCEMIDNYNPPITDDDVFNYEKYFTCNVDDSMCQYGKTANCQAVVEECKKTDKYSQQDCDNLTIVCDAIESGVIPNINQTASESTPEPTPEPTPETTTSEPTTIPVVSNPTNPVTPSGIEVPDSLMTFLNCPIGNVLCKSGKGSSCAMNSNVCRYTEPEDLGQELSNNGWEIGNLSPEQFCNAFYEVCNMIETYNPPITDDDVFNYEKYFTCNVDDSMCQYGKTANCQAVVEECKKSDKYSQQDCDNLTIVCDAIESGIIPNINQTTSEPTPEPTPEPTTSEPTTIPVVSNPTNPVTPSGIEVPDSLMTFLNCPIGNVLCKSGKGSSCAMNSNVCRYTEPEDLAQELSNNGWEIGNLSPEQFCNVFFEVCEMIDNYNPPITDDDVFNYEKYFTCNVDDSMCQYGKTANCQAVVEECKKTDKYSQQDCDNLTIVCDAIESGVIPNINQTASESTPESTPEPTPEPTTSEPTTIPVVSNPTNPVTPSGVEVPDSLMVFLNCPIGDVLCKSGKGSSCMMNSNVCRYSEPEDLGQELSNSGWEIGDLLPEQFCNVFYEVCNMIDTYNPPITDDDVFNYEKYFTCNVDDSMCQYGKTANCKAVVEKCKESEKYSQQDCDNLSIICDGVENGIIPETNPTTSESTPEPTPEPTTSEPTTIPVVSNPTNPVTPSGVEVPDSLMVFLNCPIGDVLCKSGKGSSCVMNSNVCRYTETELLPQELSNNGWEIGNLSPEQFCNAFYEVCNMIETYNPPITDDDVFNYEKYFSCNVDDSMCQYGKTANCQAVVEECKKTDKYSQQDCDNLTIICDAIESGIIPDFNKETPTTTEYIPITTTTTTTTTTNAIPTTTTTKTKKTKTIITKITKCPKKTVTKYKTTTKYKISTLFKTTTEFKTKTKTKTKTIIKNTTLYKYKTKTVYLH